MQLVLAFNLARGFALIPLIIAARGTGVMPLSFETKTLTVGELFSGNNVFRMPIFQRPYSWEERPRSNSLGTYTKLWSAKSLRETATTSSVLL